MLLCYDAAGCVKWGSCKDEVAIRVVAAVVVVAIAVDDCEDDNGRRMVALIMIGIFINDVTLLWNRGALNCESSVAEAHTR